MLKYFPVDYNNDGSSYMAQLFFLKTCGFHNFCSYWYNGFVNFLHSPPGWYFFTLPILEIFGKVNIAMYLSILLILILSFFIIYFPIIKFINNEISLGTVVFIYTILPF